MATSTPWGHAQHTFKYTDGIILYSTASHGGFHVSPTRLQQMPPYLRNESGWYEEDCEWCKVAIAFPQLFTAAEVKMAEDTLRNWFPATYETHYGLTLKPGESYVRDEETFLAEHANDYLVLSCIAHDTRVPVNFVAVLAGRGGRTPDGMYPPDCKWFLMPLAEYVNPSRLVIDPSKYPETHIVS